MPDAQAQLIQLFSHSGSTVAALACFVLIADMRKKHHIAPLPMGYRAVLPRPKAPIRDPHNMAGLSLGKTAVIGSQKRELHGFWLAKNCVAFLRNSLFVGKRGKGKAEGFGATLEVCEDAGSVAFFICRGTGIMIAHAKSQGVIK